MTDPNFHPDQQTAGIGHNSQGQLEHLADIIRACVAEHHQLESDNRLKAESASRESLKALCLAGQALVEAKDAMKGSARGAFGKWCDAARLGFGQSWRARLMKLATNWSAIDKAVCAKPEGFRDWSLNGALAEWRRSTTTGKRAIYRRPRHSVSSLLTLLNAKERELDKAKDKIRKLEKRITKGKSEPGSHDDVDQVVV